MKKYIELKGTAVEKQYLGAGNAFLVMENGSPTKLIYENPEFPAVSKDLSDDDVFNLFAENDVDFYRLERKRGKILMGTCSCYQFAFPEVLIDMEEGV
jgi:hypothetical protein